MTTRRKTLLALASAALLPGAASAQMTGSTGDWPNRPIRWVIPYAAGGTSDTLARLIGQKLGERLGQPIVIENKPGAGGNTGTDFVAKAAPDGYTMVLGNIGPMAVNRTLTRNLPYDPENDFAPISLLMAYGNVIMVNNDVPVKSLRELIDMAKGRSVPYAGNGVGTSLHLTGEMLALRTGAQFKHIPYRGGPPGLADAIAGVVPMVIDPISTALPMVTGGRLRPLAVTSPQRSLKMPNVPTVAEEGVSDFEVTGWVGVLVRKGTPEPIVRRLVTEFNSIMALPEIRSTVDDMASYIPTLGPEYFAQYIRSETVKWRDLITKANIKIE